MSATDQILADARLQVPQSAANRWAAIFGAIGLVGLGVTALGFFNEAEKADTLLSYLVAFVFLATISVGGLFFAMLQHLVGARWSVTVRRLAENFGAILPLVALLFIPIALGIKTLYPWASGEPLEEAVAAKAGYLNVEFFLGRAIFYLLTWAILGTVFYRRSLKLDESGDPQLILGMRKLAAPGILLFGVTLSFAGFDWMMSLDPTWASTMFGVYTFAGTMLSTLATIILAAQFAQRAGYLKDVVNVEHYHDLGKLLFGFIVFWAYIAFSQFFLIWYANLPEETHWFRLHWENGWSTLTVALIFLHFVIPFFAVLSRFAKRNRTIMMIVPLLLVGMHYVDLFWLVMPLKRSEPQLHLRDLTALIGMAGIGLAAVMNRMGASPLIPVKDPLLSAALEYDNG
jgi:hypothetical protein